MTKLALIYKKLSDFSDTLADTLAS